MRSTLVTCSALLVWLLDRSEALVPSCPARAVPHASHQRSFRLNSSKRTSGDMYYDEEEEETYDTRYAGDSQEARELKNMQYEADEEEYDDYYDEPDTYDDEPRSDGYEEDYEDANVGNFWSNPKESLDPYPSRRTTTRRRVGRSSSSQEERPRRRPSKSRPRTSFRSGAPSTPQNINDMYERLFWYGFDSKENMAVGDKTIFGGTKGKFNGLQVLGESTTRPPQKRQREPPQQFRADEWFDDMMESIGERYEAKDDDLVAPVRRAPRSESTPSRERRRPPPAVDDYYSDEDDVAGDEAFRTEFTERPASRKRSQSRDNWVSSEVSSWFGQDDDEYSDEEVYRRDRRPSRRRVKKKSPWSVTEVLDNVFGLNREEVDINAAAYNRQMGLGTRRPRATTGRRQGPGYAYRYVDDEEDVPPIVDYEAVVEPEVLDVVDAEAVAEEERKEQKPKRERTWEERAFAVERVPPSGVPAWGPSGEVGVDARTKATLDALEEIREATRKVELREERCIDAKEGLVVLKADVELQKKRLQASREDLRRISARLRQMQDEVDDAARALRRARAEENVARERLAALEDRHWALLSLYDADKAFREVVETFREFEESERLATEIQDVDAATEAEDIVQETTEEPHIEKGGD